MPKLNSIILQKCDRAFIASVRNVVISEQIYDSDYLYTIYVKTLFTLYLPESN